MAAVSAPVMCSDVINIKRVSHRYGDVLALNNIDLNLARGQLIGIVGPDGVGKSTLLSLIAGVTRVQEGEVETLGRSILERSHRSNIRNRLALMPQGLGQNLYGELTVAENIRFFASLFGVSRSLVNTRLQNLLAISGMTEFLDRPAAQLSGGMKQKLGLCTVLIREPELLILDEPTTGIDPLSRRNFWQLIRENKRLNTDRTILVATAYMPEAENFDYLVLMDRGKIFASGLPIDLKRRTNATKLEDAYASLLTDRRDVATRKSTQTSPSKGGEIIIEAKNLTRRFGDFTAVDRVNFSIRQGEIYGFIGPNGCGKTTTMKMLAGLLPPTTGTAHIFGRSIERGAIEIRRRLGYMSQSFSLYTEMTVAQNLRIHGYLFGLRIRDIEARLRELTRQFQLTTYIDQLASDLPVGIRQRLSLAVALIHKPELLILDEPTSGVDPLARDKTWAELSHLADKLGTTIFIATHYLDEAERCDRVALMNEGRLLTIDTPEALVRSSNEDNLEDAFVVLIEKDIVSSHAALDDERA